jgi:hypothetical protein
MFYILTINPARWMLSFVCSILIVVVGDHLTTPTLTVARQQQWGQAVAAQDITKGLQQHTETLMAVPGVVGTAQSLCDGQPCIKVFVVQATPELTQKIRRILTGYPVVIQETGPIRARPAQQ